MPGWIDAQTLGDFVKDNLAKAPSSVLKDHWSSIIAAAVTFGYQEIVSAFAERGFLLAQVAQWDRGLEFHRDLGAWYALRKMQQIQTDVYSDKALTVLDRRMDLRGDKAKDWAPVPLTIAGVAQYPAGTFGMPEVVPIDTAGDMFVMPTSQQDSRIGQTTRL